MCCENDDTIKRIKYSQSWSIETKLCENNSKQVSLFVMGSKVKQGTELSARHGMMLYAFCCCIECSAKQVLVDPC